MTSCILHPQQQAFRFHQESRARLDFLSACGKIEDSLLETSNVQASHAETVLELQKTRNLLLVEHSISKDLQVHTEISVPRWLSIHFAGLILSELPPKLSFLR